MNIFVLPRELNKALIRTLRGCYIREDFATLMHNIAIYLRSARIQSSKGSKDLVVAINDILLINVYKYLESGAYALFLESLNSGRFVHDLVIERYHVCEIVRDMAGMALSDVDNDEVENLILMELSSYIAHIYHSDAASFNAVLLESFEVMRTVIPVSRIRLMRFTMTEDMVPLAVYANGST